MHGILRLILPILAAALLGGCGSAPDWGAGTRMPNPPAGPEWVRAERALRSLSRERARFLAERRAEDVFAVFYYHVTDGVISMARQGKLRHPEFWLNETGQFHDAYAKNRQAGTREAHWHGYYAKAASIPLGRLAERHVAGPGDLWGNPGLASLGAIAHIRGDLPASLASTRAQHPGLCIACGSALERDFNDLSIIFATACQRGYGDLARVLPPQQPGYLDLLPLRDPITAWIIARERQKAWHAFVSGSL